MRFNKFSVSQLFPELENGKANQTLLEDGDDCFYIGAKKNDNGVMRYCKYNSDLVQNGNCILFICNGAGSVGYSLYMDRPFMATSDVVAGYNENLTPFIGLYLVSLFDLERPRYSYGRKWKNTLRQTTISLPVDENDEPDWKWMEDFMKEHILLSAPSRTKELFLHSVNTDSIISNHFNLTGRPWEYIELNEVFTRIYKAQPHVKSNLNISERMIDGYVPFISRTESNNGCDGYVNAEDVEIESGNAIIIGDTIASIFFQEFPFTTGDHIVICRTPNLNKYNALFIVTILRLEKYRFNYGRAFKKQIVETHKIKLPVKSDGTPDWEFMENYIKGLPFSSNL